MEADGFEGEGNAVLGPCLTSYMDNGSSESHRYYLARRTVLEMLRDRGYAVPNSEIQLSLQDFRAIHGQNPDLERLRISTTFRSDPLKRFVPEKLLKERQQKEKFKSFVSCVLIWKRAWTVDTVLVMADVVQLRKHSEKPTCGEVDQNEKTKHPHCLVSFRSFCFSLMILVIFCGPGVVKVNVIRLIASQIVNKDTLSGLILIVQNHITSQAMKAVDLFPFKAEIFQITDLLVNITKHVLKPKHRILTDQEKRRLLKKYNIEEKQLPRMLRKDAIARYYGLEKGQVVKVTYGGGEITESHVTYRCVW